MTEREKALTRVARRLSCKARLLGAHALVTGYTVEVTLCTGNTRRGNRRFLGIIPEAKKRLSKTMRACHLTDRELRFSRFINDQEPIQ